jgi:aspartate kinase
VDSAPDPATATVVMKFGGSSVREPEQVRQVAQRLVAAREEGLRVVGTISALGRTTNSLLELARRVSPDPDPRELDMLLSTGERTACALVAMAVHDLGHDAVSLTGSQAGILTDAVYTRAKIREITPVRVLQALDAGTIVLVAGFQGFSRDTMDLTTLGRGGTDATAVALAAALGATCEIYTEAPGVFTADPGIVSDARKLAVVSYEEMLEMAASGTKALTVRAVELARSHDVPIHARSTFSNELGTLVQRMDTEEPTLVSAVIHSQDEVVFGLADLPDRLGAVAAVLDAVAAEEVSVDTVFQHLGNRTARLSCSVPTEDLPAARRALARAKGSIGPFRISEIANLGMVSLVGAGMRSQPGVAALMFGTLAEQGIEPRLISTSPIKISSMIDRAEVECAVRALHAAFALGDETPLTGTD